MEWIYTLHLRVKKLRFCTFSVNSRMCYLFCFKNIVHLQLFATSGAGPPAFATPLMLYDDFFMVIAWDFNETPIRNLRLEHRFCKFAFFWEMCWISNLDWLFPLHLRSKKLLFLQFSQEFDLEHIFKAKKYNTISTFSTKSFSHKTTFDLDWLSTLNLKENLCQFHDSIEIFAKIH